MTNKPLYPLLFAICLILQHYSKNIDHINRLEVIRPIIILLVITFSLMKLVETITRDEQYAAFLTFLFLTCFFIFEPVRQSIEIITPFFTNQKYYWVVFTIWLLMLCLAGLPRTWGIINRYFNITQFLNITTTILLVFPSIDIGMKFLPTIFDSRSKNIASFDSIGEIELKGDQRPDIYVIIVDGYGRSDVLKNIYGLDNSDFINYLHEKNFYVAQESHSNYFQTPLSIAALLNFGTFTSWAPSDNNLLYSLYMINPILENRLFPILIDMEYKIITYDSRFYYTQIAKTDKYITRWPGNLTAFEGLFLVNSPIDKLSTILSWNLPFYNEESHREHILFLLDSLIQIPRETSPKLVFAHILAPHPPFIFDKYGNPKSIDTLFNIFDASDYPGTAKEYQQGYAEQLLYINQRLREVIDSILEQTPDAIIILQGDHGPGSMFKWDSLETSCLFERASILYALHSPLGKNLHLYPTISTSNTFRVILNDLWGTSLPLVEDKTFYTTWRDPGLMVDITSIRESLSNCSPAQ